GGVRGALERADGCGICARIPYRERGRARAVGSQGGQGKAGVEGATAVPDALPLAADALGLRTNGLAARSAGNAPCDPLRFPALPAVNFFPGLVICAPSSKPDGHEINPPGRTRPRRPTALAAAAAPGTV